MAASRSIQFELIGYSPACLCSFQLWGEWELLTLSLEKEDECLFFSAKMHLPFSVLTIVSATSSVVALVTGTSTLSTWPRIVLPDWAIPVMYALTAMVVSAFLASAFSGFLPFPDQLPFPRSDQWPNWLVHEMTRGMASWQNYNLTRSIPYLTYHDRFDDHHPYSPFELS